MGRAQQSPCDHSAIAGDKEANIGDANTLYSLQYILSEPSAGATAECSSTPPKQALCYVSYPTNADPTSTVSVMGVFWVEDRLV